MVKGLVVLEGADSSGKTTLAKRLGADVYMHGLPWVGWVEEAHSAMLEAAKRHVKLGKLVAIDRHWVSEYVYGPIFRKRIAYSDEMAAWFDKSIRRIGVYVLCIPSDGAAHEVRFQRERPEKKDLFTSMVDVAEDFRRLAEGGEGTRDDYFGSYVRHGSFTRSDCVVYDMDRDPMDNAIDNIAGMLEKKHG